MMAAVCLFMSLSGLDDHYSPVSGNGGLTVSLDLFGNVSSCRWPSPSHCEQIDLTREQKFGTSGPMWGIRLKDRTQWLTTNILSKTSDFVIPSAYPITELSFSIEGLACTQTVFVHPERDLLVIHLTVRGRPLPADVYWYADFSP